MIILMGIILIILGLIFTLLGILKKPTQPLKIDLRLPAGGIIPSVYTNLSYGIILFSFGIFLLLYPVNALLSYIISGSAVSFALFLWLRTFLKGK